MCLHSCLSAGCGHVGVKDSVCQQHSTPYHQCVIIPSQVRSACSVIFLQSGVASASTCSFTHHTFYIWMERGITIAAGLAGKRASGAPEGSRHKALWLCSSALWSLLNWKRDLRNWKPRPRRGLTPKAGAFTADVSTCVRNNSQHAGTKWGRRTWEITSSQQGRWNH